ncbi:MAG: hypothetical protein ACRCVX_13200 [Shewanella sp.]
MSSNVFFEVAEESSKALEVIDLGGRVGTVHVRPMSGEAFYKYVELAEQAGDEPAAYRQARLLFNHARDASGELVFKDEDEKKALDKLVQLPFGILQKFSQDMLAANGLIKSEKEKND